MKYTINDLPRFSEWPARLLGFIKTGKRLKTPVEIIREFECDKWGLLYDQIARSSGRLSIEDIDKLYLGTDESLFYMDKEFSLKKYTDMHRTYIQWLENELGRYLPASTLCELGCGYGSVILSMAQSELFKNMPFIAADFTQQGIDIVEYLGKSLNVSLITGRCDFTQPHITDVTIPDGSIIFTSYALTYVPVLSLQFLRKVASWRPKVVVHVEPCYEHCDEKSLHGLMQKRYMEINDYNRNFITRLHEAEDGRWLEIIKETPCFIGQNPLLAASLVIWRPLQ